MIILKKKKVKKEGPEGFDFEAYEQEVAKGLMSGKGLTGGDGLFKLLIARFVETALEAELESHLAEEKTGGLAKLNKRNGRRGKEIKTEAEPVRRSTRRRHGTGWGASGTPGTGSTTALPSCGKKIGTN